MIAKPKKLDDYKRYLNTINGLDKNVKDLQLNLSIKQLKQDIEDYYTDLIEQHKKKEFIINSKYESLLKDRVQELKEETTQYNQKVKETFEENNNTYINLDSNFCHAE